MNVNQEAAGEARAKIFCSLVMKEGTLKRGIITHRMRVSTQTFAREYRDYLDQYPTIKYDREKREFVYSP